MADIYFRPDGANRFQIRSAAGLTLPSAWLDQEFNRIYSYLNTIEGGGATTGSEWATVQVEATPASTTSFTVEGDYSGVFEALRAIRFKDDNDTYTISHIKSVAYVGGTNLTTVTVYDAVVPATIEAIEVGLIGSEAQPIPSLSYKTRTSGYTVGASDEVIFVDDGTVGNLTKTWDDGATGGDETAYYALWITLPVASDMPGKLLCIKKISGSYRTIVASTATRTDTTEGGVTTHNYSYVFQIYGDSEAKNRVTLKGIGDCYWLFSNGNRWYELTPEASETVKGVVRFATDSEMTLTAEQLADDEELSKNLAVSPYQVDKEYLRTDGSNLRFASNYIYKAPNGVASLVNNNIIVYNGLGLNIPDGRDDDGVIKVKKLELDSNITYAPVEVTNKTKLLFLREDKSLQSILAKDFFACYETPTPINTTTGDRIIWFDWGSNTIKESTDNGTNWTTFNGGGPICLYYGNGTTVTFIEPYAPVGFLDRTAFQTGIRYDKRQVISYAAPNFSASFTRAAGSFSYPYPFWVFAHCGHHDSARIILTVGGTTFITSGTGSYNQGYGTAWFVDANETISVTGGALTINIVPCKGKLLFE